MRKVFSIILLAVSLFLGSQAVSMNEAIAQDVWAYNDGYNDHYLVAPVKHV